MDLLSRLSPQVAPATPFQYIGARTTCLLGECNVVFLGEGSEGIPGGSAGVSGGCACYRP